MPSEPRNVRYWAAGCSVSEDLWKYRRESTTVTCDPRGRALEATDGALHWPDYLDASELDAVAVEGDGLDSVQWRLWWSDDDTFAEERSLAAAPAGAGPHRVSFDLGAARAWRGRVRRFRLTWTGTPAPGARVAGAWGTRGGGD